MRAHDSCAFLARPAILAHTRASSTNLKHLSVPAAIPQLQGSLAVSRSPCHMADPASGAGPSGASSSEVAPSPSPASSSGAANARRGVPAAQFVANVAEFVGTQDVEAVIKGLEERLQQYRMVEMKMLTQQRDLQSKVPEIQKSLEVVKRLEAHLSTDTVEEVRADFEISEGIFATASIPSAESVCLWLGANVMLEYPMAEAQSLLTTNLANASSSLEALQADVEFLRDQINTTEVTIARVHNWDVKNRRQRQTS